MSTDLWGVPIHPQIPWHCVVCETPASLRVLDRWWLNPGPADEWEPHERVLAKCLTCQAPYVLGREADYNDAEGGPLEQLWPPADPPLPHYVPKSIRSAHDEALRCRTIHAHTAVALLARRGVEAICAEHGQRNGTLASKLQALLDAGEIDTRLFEWSSVVRDLGNSGAHDVEATLTREDSDDALAFFEALVNYLYTFQRRYEQHKKRKAEER